MKYFENIIDTVGNTPLVKLKVDSDIKPECFVKLEGNNPTGSIKDRTAIAILTKEIEEGRLTKGKTILDASSGSYACSLSYFGRILGFPVTVVTGSKLTNDKLNFIKYFGAELISEGDFTIQGNKYCRDILLKEDSDRFCFLDQLHNWENPQIHYKTTGPEIINAMQDVEAIVFSLGSGGTMNGIARYIKEHKMNIKLIGVSAATQNKIPGVGAFVDGDYITPFIKSLFDNNSLDYLCEIDTERAIAGVKKMRDQGFYVGIQSGAVYEGMLEGIRKLNINKKVVMISGDAGWKNMDKLINVIE